MCVSKYNISAEKGKLHERVEGKCYQQKSFKRQVLQLAAKMFTTHIEVPLFKFQLCSQFQVPTNADLRSSGGGG